MAPPPPQRAVSFICFHGKAGIPLQTWGKPSWRDWESVYKAHGLSSQRVGSLLPGTGLEPHALRPSPGTLMCLPGCSPPQGGPCGDTVGTHTHTLPPGPASLPASAQDLWADRLSCATFHLPSSGKSLDALGSHLSCFSFRWRKCPLHLMVRVRIE